MKIKQIDINQLRPAEYNPRKITEAELDKLEQSLREFGMVKPVVVNQDMTVIGGHQTLRVLQQRLGQKTAPCIVLDLDKHREKLLNLALNRIGGDFDPDKLKSLLLDLRTAEVNLTLSGFDQVETEKLLLPPDPPPVGGMGCQRHL